MRKYIIPILLSILISGCIKDENKHPVPDIPIYIEPIFIYGPEYISLSDAFGMVLIKNVGYMGNGILIVNTGLIHDEHNPYMAYDATCPNEISQECAISIDESSISLVTCPCCGSQFEVNFGGVNKGPAKYPLKTYKTAFDGEYIRVYN